MDKFENSLNTKKEVTMIMSDLGFYEWSDFVTTVKKIRFAMKESGKISQTDGVGNAICREILKKKRLSDSEYQSLKQSVKDAIFEVDEQIRKAKEFQDNEAERAGYGDEVVIDGTTVKIKGDSDLSEEALKD